MNATGDSLDKAAISGGLQTRFIGRNMILLPTVDSTNGYLKGPGGIAAANGTVAIADGQTQGRGRKGRTFVSKKGEGIYLSILLKPDKRLGELQLLTICAATAVSKAIDDVCGIYTEIKWVNDVYAYGKKLCGILTETKWVDEQEPGSVIVGIGVNTGRVPDELRDIATSILEITGKTGIRNRLIAKILNLFEEIYLDYTENGKIGEITEYYDERLFIKGRQVTVTSGNDAFTATVLGIDKTGALIARDDKGFIRHTNTGEITLI